jgi:hypothetical protein
MAKAIIGETFLLTDAHSMVFSTLRISSSPYSDRLGPSTD